MVNKGILHSSPLMLAALLGSILLAPSLGWAGGIEVTVDRNRAAVGEHIVMSVKVEGDRSAAPELPPLPDFQVHSRGQSTQMQIINGAVNSSIKYTYIIIPTKPGKYTVGQASVEFNGKRYTSRPFKLTILDASETPQEEATIFLDAKISNQRPYVGEQVIFTWRLYRRVRVTGADASFPDFDGFTVADIGEQRDFSTNLNGQRYDVTEIRKALFAQEAGKLTLPGTSLTADVVVEKNNRRRARNGSLIDEFFSRGQTQRKVLRTKPIEFDVQPLPPSPQGYSGLVGDFKISAKVSKRTLKVGESTTLTIAVSGTGNWTAISEPKFPELNQFKIYSDKSTATDGKNGQEISGRKVFKKALVPLEKGKHELPRLKISYFDTATGEYRTKQTRRINLLVSPSDEAEDLKLTEARAPGLGKVAVKVLANDILPLKKDFDSLTRDQGTLPYSLFGLGVVSPAFLFFGLATARRRRELEASDDSLRRRRIAWPEARAELKEIDAKQGSLEDASRIIRSFLGNMLNLEGGALTTTDTERHLQSKGIDITLIERTTKLLARCEEAQYAAPGAAQASLPPQLRQELESILNELNQGLEA